MSLLFFRCYWYRTHTGRFQSYLSFPAITTQSSRHTDRNTVVTVLLYHMTQLFVSSVLSCSASKKPAAKKKMYLNVYRSVKFYYCLKWKKKQYDRFSKDLIMNFWYQNCLCLSQVHNIVAGHLRRGFANSMAWGQYNGNGKRGSLQPGGLHKNPPGFWHTLSRVILNLKCTQVRIHQPIQWLRPGDVGQTSLSHKTREHSHPTWFRALCCQTNPKRKQPIELYLARKFALLFL